MHSAGSDRKGCPIRPGCPIRKSSDQSLVGGSPRHIAASSVLLRLRTPRHPPYTLSSLTTFMNRCGKLHLCAIRQARNARLSARAADPAAAQNYERTNHSHAGQCGTAQSGSTRSRFRYLSSRSPMNLSQNPHQPQRTAEAVAPFTSEPSSIAPQAATVKRSRPTIRKIFSNFFRARLRAGGTANPWRCRAGCPRHSDWSRPGSNRQPLPCKGSALPVELRPRSSREPGDRLAATAAASTPAAARRRPGRKNQQHTQRNQRPPVRHGTTPIGRSPDRPDGPDKIRTCDLVLIRDAL